MAKNLYGDFDNPELNAKLKRDAQPWLRRDNAQMYKIDRGNAQRMDPYFTCQAYWETWDEEFHGDFVTLPRVVAFRGNKHVNGKWPGDNLNFFDYPSGLMANVAPMLNLPRLVAADTNVALDGRGLDWRVSFCARRYRRFEGLYDVSVALATTELRGRGLVAQLGIDGISEERARVFLRRSGEAIEWQP